MSRRADEMGAIGLNGSPKTLVTSAKNDAREMLRLVGGKENIAAFTHCVTRMRFTLVDPSIADVPAIEALPAAKGSFTVPMSPHSTTSRATTAARPCSGTTPHVRASRRARPGSM